MLEELKQVREALETCQTTYDMSGYIPEHCYDDELVEKALTLLDTIITGQGWQNIDKAPKTSEPVLVMLEDGRIFHAYYDFSYDCPEKGKGYGERVYKSASDCSYNIKPVYFMPLPPPPQPASEGR